MVRQTDITLKSPLTLQQNCLHVKQMLKHLSGPRSERSQGVMKNSLESVGSLPLIGMAIDKP